MLDAAAGIPHMLKWFLAGKCKETWAVDIDDRIVSMDTILHETRVDIGFKNYNALLDIPNIYNNVNFVHSSISSLPLNDMPKFDRIFCVSVLEHMTFQDIVSALKQMKRALKSSGLIIITMDYPDIKPQGLVEAAALSGLVPLADIIYDIPSNDDALFNPNLNLHVFRLALAHKTVDKMEL